MSKKKLLSESQVRRFMGLAGIKPLNEMYNMEEDDEMREGGMREEELDEMRGQMKKDDPMHEEEEAESPEPEMEAADADVEMDEEDLADVAQALSTLQDKLAPLLDQAPEGEDDMEEPAEEPEMDMPEEKPEGEEDMDMGDEEELMEVEMELNEEEIVNEVARRVAKRIVEAKRAHKKMNEALGRKK